MISDDEIKGRKAVIQWLRDRAEEHPKETLEELIEFLDSPVDF